MDSEAVYVCDHCGEEIVVPIDLSAGEEQSYVEDCPVCCSPNVLHVTVDDDGRASVWSEGE
ncbi:MAG: CPXCG motif-containing cysteine-rich protein [Planctomycetales bacterium]|nr:CPXCG motif-containing cysteine-rich protein [Planctomycetales bacterium]